MERLNDIMMRNAQRRQEIQEQRSRQEDRPAQGPRPKQPITRRHPLPEQTARLGQQNSYIAPPPQSPHKQAQQAIPPATGNRGEQGARYPQQHPYDQVAHKSEAQRRSLYQHPGQEPAYFASGQREPKITGDYYDAYPAAPPADVQEGWEDDEEGMHYGDWETEGNYDGHPSPPTDRGTPFPALAASQNAAWSSSTSRVQAHLQASALQKTRELSSIPALDPAPRSPLTRNLRDEHAFQAQVSTPPVPQAPAQEAQHYHRNTQPLNPRTMEGMGQQIAQGVSRVNISTQQAARQARMRNSTTRGASVPFQGPCPQCKGAGYLRADVPYGHPNFGKPIACECKEVERAEKRRLQLRSMSNLDAFSDKSFRNFNPRVPGVQEAFKVARFYAENPDGWLLLIGKNGCGKTHLAAAIANQHLAQGSLVLFATVPDLLDHLRATFAPTSTVVYDQLFSTMREAELLVLDDLGSEQNSPWASEKLFQLLNYRYNSRFPTVITTNNLRLQALDERIRSRLMDKNLVIEVTMDRVQDYRPHNPRRE